MSIAFQPYYLHTPHNDCKSFNDKSSLEKKKEKFVITSSKSWFPYSELKGNPYVRIGAMVHLFYLYGRSGVQILV